MLPVTVVYFCYGWTLWLYLNWLPSFFLHEYNLISAVGAVRVGRVLRAASAAITSAASISDRILKRTGDLRKARRNVVFGGFLGAFVCLLPIFLTHDLTLIVVLSLGGVLLRRDRDRTDVGDSDGHRAEVLRHRRADS